MASALRQRVVSAALILPLILALLWLGGPWILALLLLLTAVTGGIEAGRIFRGLGWRCTAVQPAVASVVMAFSLAGWPGGLRAPLTAALVLLSVLWLIRPMRPARPVSGVSAWLAHVLGGAYIGLMLSFLALLAAGPWPGAAQEADGARRLLLALGIVWAGDTGAYLVGSTFGRRRLWPSVSPAKTWEGAAGGVLFAIAAGCLLPGATGLPLAPVYGALIGVMGGVAGQVGDLVESRFKRAAGIKDSGSFMPGHGGMLDRLDSILPAAPVVYYALRFWIH